MSYKQKQIGENKRVKEMYEEFIHQFKPWSDNTVIDRLRYCTAHVYTDPNGWIALRSYNTFVAFITPNGDFVDILRLVYGYTSTSAQHIRKFYQDYSKKVKYYYTYLNV